MSEYAIQRLLANVRTQLPGSIDPTIKLELFNTMVTFCRDSNVWQESQSFNTKVNKQDYEVTADASDAYYTQLLRVQAYDPEDPNGETTTPIDVAAWMVGPTTLHFKDKPQTVQRMRATFAVAPRPTDKMEDYPSIPDEFWDTYHDVLLEGVLSRMMSQQAKPYSNERLAIFHGRRFKAGTSVAKHEFYNGSVRGGQNWHFPQNFARGSTR